MRAVWNYRCYQCFNEAVVYRDNNLCFYCDEGTKEGNNMHIHMKQPVRIVIDGRLYEQEKDAIRAVDTAERKILRDFSAGVGILCLALGLFAAYFI